MRKVSIVIVNWNGKNDTLACLATLEKIHKANIELAVIVVDNGSTDDSRVVIPRLYPWVKLSPAGKNLGFTGGSNVGIHEALKAKADYVWLLNNDTLVDKNALALLNVFSDPTVGIAGSKIYFAAGHEFHRDRYTKEERGRVLWYAGGLIDWQNMYASHQGVDEVDQGQFDKIEETSFITGCSMMISRRVFERIGVLDKHFYLYLEDLDFCLRAKKAGFKLMYAPNSKIWHVNAGSSGRPGNPLHNYYLTRNRLIIGLRYAPLHTKLALGKEAVKFLLGSDQIKRRAVMDFILGRWGKQYEPQKLTS